MAPKVIEAPMRLFIVRIEAGEYVTGCRLTSNYIDYKLVADRDVAQLFNDFDSQLVVKRLRAKSVLAERIEVESLRD